MTQTRINGMETIGSLIAQQSEISIKIESVRKQLSQLQDKEQTLNSRLDEVMGKLYYVYIVYSEGNPVYVGKGKGGRFRHTISGKSSCLELNRDYFNGKYIEVLIVEDRLEEDAALSTEAWWINYIHNENKERGLDFYNKNFKPVEISWIELEIPSECYYYGKFKKIGDNATTALSQEVKPRYITFRDLNEPVHCEEGDHIPSWRDI